MGALQQYFCSRFFKVPMNCIEGFVTKLQGCQLICSRFQFFFISHVGGLKPLQEGFQSFCSRFFEDSTPFVAGFSRFPHLLFKVLKPWAKVYSLSVEGFETTVQKPSVERKCTANPFYRVRRPPNFLQCRKILAKKTL